MKKKRQNRCFSIITIFILITTNIIIANLPEVKAEGGIENIIIKEGEEISFNVARNRYIDHPLGDYEHWALAEGGEYHKPELFLKHLLNGVDLTRFHCRITPPAAEVYPAQDGLRCVVSLRVMNPTDK